MGRDISQPVRNDSSLERWRVMLDDTKLLRDMPRIYRDNLLNLSEDLQRRGVIDCLERFDMDEMANAAYEHEIEEQLVLRRYYIGPGNYKLLQDGARVGEARGCRLYLGASTRDLPPNMYTARIERTGNGLEAISKYFEVVGRVEGKEYITADGEVYELVETSRIVVNVETHAIDDPDIYRALLDAIQHTAERGDIQRHDSLTTRASISVFMPCPACEDVFSRREDCIECNGRGFVTESPARFRWRC